jgi:hypothetical protein
MTKIDSILTKYENFYKGGSGYTFQVEVDDFNELVKHVKWLEHLNNGLEYKLKTCKEDVCEMEKEIVEHCETKGLAGRQVFALTKRVDELVEENGQLKNKLNHFMKDSETKQEIIYKLQRQLEKFTKSK